MKCPHCNNVLKCACCKEPIKNKARLKWQKNNPKKYNESMRKWRAKDREGYNAYQRERRKKKKTGNTPATL